METVEREENQQNKMPGDSVNNIEDKKTKFELEQEKVSDWKKMIQIFNGSNVNIFIHI